MSSQASATTKHVRFSDTPPEIHINKRYKNPQDLYYSGDELAQMQELARVTEYFSDRELKRMNVDLRGLEPASVSQRDDQKRGFLKDFLKLQRKLRKSDFNERQKSLQTFAGRRSGKCEREAIKMGKKDEAEARRIYKADKISYRRADSADSSGTASSKTKAFLGSLVNGFRPTSESSFLMGRAA